MESSVLIDVILGDVSFCKQLCTSAVATAPRDLRFANFAAKVDVTEAASAIMLRQVTMRRCTSIFHFLEAA